MVWRPGDGYIYNNRRSDGWPQDQHAPDGYLVSGFRKVRKGGVVLASGQRWQHDDLLPFIGKMVRYQIEDPFSTTISIFIGAHVTGVEITPFNYIEHHSSFYEKPLRINDHVNETKHSTRAIDNARKKGWNI